MTKQEIITKCIEAYTEAIEVCGKLKLEDAKSWLLDKRLHLGVCVYSKHVLKNGVTHKEWVIRNQSELSGHWTTHAYKCISHPKLIQSLITRLEILQRELSIPE